MDELHYLSRWIHYIFGSHGYSMSGGGIVGAVVGSGIVYLAYMLAPQDRRHQTWLRKTCRSFIF